MAQIRLDKYLANAGCGTRTEVKQFLKKGLVTVNGVSAAKPEQKLDPQKDQVCLRGESIGLEEFVYYMLNKPAGYLSATEDSRQPVVLDLIREKKKSGLFPVGRLDIDTEGLLLLTNDGALAHRLLSPGKHVDKTYYARILGKVTEQDCRLFAEGLDIGEKKKTMPARLVILPEGGYGDEISEIRVTIQEGKFHQVKRMFEAVGKKVIYLKRLSMGSLKLDSGLSPGMYRRLTEEEIEKLRQNQ
ncbi:MAG: pseudouridine synthase [Lachnospiraceae bacterium]|nr:pseudouridine synthase [Lachnospiraceae bacterium]